MKNSNLHYNNEIRDYVQYFEKGKKTRKKKKFFSFFWRHKTLSIIISSFIITILYAIIGFLSSVYFLNKNIFLIATIIVISYIIFLYIYFKIYLKISSFTNCIKRERKLGLPVFFAVFFALICFIPIIGWFFEYIISTIDE